MRIFSTGILSLDTQLRGGFPSGKVILFLEEPGTGGEIFTFHLANEGLKNGEKVLYITTDYPENEIINNMKLYFKHDLNSEILNNMKILDFFSPRVTIFNRKEDVKAFVKNMRHDYIGEIKNRLKNEDYDRVVINNLTYFLVNYPFEEVTSMLDELNMVAKVKDNLIVLLLTKDMFERRVETAIKHYSDGVIELSIKEIENEIQRRLKILKLEGYMVPKSILRYELTDKGISMESVMRVM